jgi:hypothetical protein
MEPITAIFFSCRRLDLLKQTIDSFIRSDSYPLKDMIIVNDSGDSDIHHELRLSYPFCTLVLHPENVGLMKSIDLGYKHIKTEYFYHCEDDWCCNGKDGFLEQSLDIMLNNSNIEEVWLADYNNYPKDYEVLYTPNSTPFQLLKENQNGWHGFTTACGLKRKSDYLKVGFYSEIERGETIWHHERNIGLKYHNLGYRSAILLDEYVYNIGIGKSEYKLGYEK